MADATSSTHNVSNPRNDLPLDWVRRVFGYNPLTGHLTRLGHRVGWLHPTGYRYYSIGRYSYKEHRIIWLLVHGEWPDQIDHIDGDRSNNCIANLRNVTGSQNQRAIRKPNKNNTTGYRGVTYLKGERKYAAQIKILGKSVRLGRFPTAAEASRAYEARAASLRD